MERLTFEGNFCDIAQCIGEPGNTSACYGGYCDQRRTWERLKEFEDAVEEGRAWFAPCPMDAQLYRIVEGEAPHTHKRHKYIRVIYLSENNFFGVLRDFGKTAFLTLEEAQKALEGMKNGK